MSIQDLIDKLYELKEPSRDLEIEVAQLVGWKQRSEKFLDDKGNVRERTLYLVPNGDKEGKVPRYTLYLHDAFNLAQLIAPDHVGGVAWENGMGSARINNGPYVQAASAPIALTIAALTLLQQKVTSRR
ncbi:hypothetical protein M0654_11310 [Rhizobium sp. NTR19]|uniref:Uncharacterized protein n=1 Tax=Neorhizobium turbinariae TaxID=2937795 RepID=A0ABT0IRT5_9HYPH|nr:hypothetical protein [Neorhizobium turbinariae]MCK8780574.1 hypothetical protein [Neorhizobium turbinariae]